MGFHSFWLAGFCAGFHILFQPFSVCIQGCAVMIIMRHNKTPKGQILVIFQLVLFIFSAEHPRRPSQRIPVPSVMRREHDRWQSRILTTYQTSRHNQNCLLIIPSTRALSLSLSLSLIPPPVHNKRNRVYATDGVPQSPAIQIQKLIFTKILPTFASRI